MLEKLAFAVALGLSACTPAAPPLDKANYAASLNVDISASTLISGMYIRDTTVGTGAPAETGKQITMQYTGFLVDGTKFDASLTSGFQFQLGVGEVIHGWDLGVGPPVAMNVGGVRQLIIPPSLGYGSAGKGPIPGNAILVFNVTMVSTP